jgi:hypothetical protein
MNLINTEWQKLFLARNLQIRQDGCQGGSFMSCS